MSNGRYEKEGKKRNHQTKEQERHGIKLAINVEMCLVEWRSIEYGKNSRKGTAAHSASSVE